MKYLLDTHTFLWFATDNPRISEKAKQIIQNRKNQLLLSAASVWEISIKYSIGKISLSTDLDNFISESLRSYNLTPLPISIPHSIEVSRLPEIHRDPFDRMLIAQSRIENAGIITTDKDITKYDVKTIW